MLNAFSDVSMVTTALAVTTVPLILWLFLRRKTYSPPLPPSPGVSLPIIGHLHLLKKDHKESFREFRKKLGDVYSLQFGNKLVVVLSGYDTIKEAFKTKGDQFPNRGNLPILDKVTRNMGELSIRVLRGCLFQKLEETNRWMDGKGKCYSLKNV